MEDKLMQARRVAHSNKQILESGEYYLTLVQFEALITGETEPELRVSYYNRQKPHGS